MFRSGQNHRDILQKLRVGARHLNRTLLATTATVQNTDHDLYHNHAHSPEVEVEVDLEVGIEADRLVEPRVLTIPPQEVQRSALSLSLSFFFLPLVSLLQLTILVLLADTYFRL